MQRSDTFGTDLVYVRVINSLSVLLFVQYLLTIELIVLSAYIDVDL